MRITSLATVAATVLVAAGLPLLAVPAAYAEEGCLTEEFAIPRCDDSTPPTTTITGVSPEPNAAGWLASTTVTFTFEGAHTDADTDPIRFECQFSDAPVASTTWTACTSPVTYDDLRENQATPYTFRVRAVDSADALIDVTSPLVGRQDTPDLDATPDSTSFTADATAPNTYGYLRTTYADESGNAPMLTSPSAEFRLQSAEASGYDCRLDREPVRCAEGIVMVRDLTAGRHTFTATAIDAAGNADPTPFVQELFVPRNLALADVERESRGAWSRHREPGTFRGDYLESRTYGAVLSFYVRNVREIRLITPTGPDFGKVEVRVGRGRWYPVSLRSAERKRLVVHDLRGDVTTLVAGLLQVRVASQGKVVRVDAVSAR